MYEGMHIRGEGVIAHQWGMQRVSNEDHIGGYEHKKRAKQKRE